MKTIPCRRGSRLLAVAMCSACCLLLAGCGNEPFKMVNISGKITYEDGSLIPAKDNSMRLTFIPLTLPADTKTHPRPGVTDVDLKDGTFGCVTSHKYGDGLVAGKHKVMICTATPPPALPKGVPPEYFDPTKTPLEVDTASVPFHLKIKKP